MIIWYIINNFKQLPLSNIASVSYNIPALLSSVTNVLPYYHYPTFPLVPYNAPSLPSICHQHPTILPLSLAYLQHPLPRPPYHTTISTAHPQRPLRSTTYHTTTIPAYLSCLASFLSRFLASPSPLRSTFPSAFYLTPHALPKPCLTV